jgi:inorganic triphosphatase YgiF
MSASTGWISAIIAAAVSLLVFVLTQFWTSRREQRTQTYHRRRAALTEVQDAALDLRTALATFGPLARNAFGREVGGELAAAQRRVDEAFALLDVRLTRIDDAEVTQAVIVWRDMARFHYVSLEEVTTADEQAAWAQMNTRLGAALTSGSGRSP